MTGIAYILIASPTITSSTRELTARNTPLKVLPALVMTPPRKIPAYRARTTGKQLQDLFHHTFPQRKRGHRAILAMPPGICQSDFKSGADLESARLSSPVSIARQVELKLIESALNTELLGTKDHYLSLMSFDAEAGFEPATSFFIFSLCQLPTYQMTCSVL
jgi:hypothetical protein